MNLRRFISWMPLLAALVLASCSGKTMVESDLGLKGAPDWINEGTQTLNDKGGRLFHGVGQAPRMGDESLQISTADNRARAEVARILSSYMDVVSSDYSSAARSGDEAVAEQSVSRQIKNFTKINLSGAKIIAHWKDKKSGVIYSLAELDMKRIKDAIKTSKDMNEDVKRYISEHGDSIFDRYVSEGK